MRELFFITAVLFSLQSFGMEKVVIKGNFKLGHSESKGSFIVRKNKNGDHFLRVAIIGSKEYCDFKIKRKTAPQQLKGRSGLIYSNRPKSCLFKHLNPKVEEEFNQIVLVDLFYRLDKSGNTYGSYGVSLGKKIYRGNF